MADGADEPTTEGRWPRRVRLALAAVGVLLTLAAIATWVPRGDRGGGAFVLSPGGGVIAAGAADGAAVLYAARYDLGPGQPWTAQTFGGGMGPHASLQQWLSGWTSGYSPSLRGRWGFVADAARIPPYPTRAGQYHVVGYQRAWAVLAVPAWAMLLGGLLLATPAARHELRQISRRRAGRCLGCGYDLRHSPTRCPECGLAVKTPACVEELPKG